ncbi:MAG TPA: hypothetical protein VFU93_10330 [Acidimicrobiales bacterium]|nr:hypothetical protein [Acidimicrobiales bacterium]
MPFSYPIDATLAAIQLTLGAVLLFVVMPWLVFAPHTRHPFGRRMPEHAAAGVVVAGLLVPALAMLRLLDAVSLLASVGLLGVVAARRRGVEVRRGLRRTWRRMASVALDRFESGRPSITRPSWRRLDPGPGRRAVLAGGIALGGLVVWQSIAEALVHAGPDLPGHGVRVLRLERLALRDAFADGVHHSGLESVLSAIGRVVTVDTPLLVRLAPGLVSIALVAGVVWSGWRLTDRAAAGLVSGAVVALAGRAAWWPIDQAPSSDALAVSAACAFAAPALAVAVDVWRGRTSVPAIGVVLAAASLLHPVIGALLALAIIVGWVVAAAIGPRTLSSVPLAAAIGAAVGWLPIVAGLAVGEPWNAGPFGIEAALGPAFRAVTGVPPDVDRPHLLLLGALVAAFVVVVVPHRLHSTGSGLRIFGGAVIALVAALQLYRIGVDDPTAPGVAGAAGTAALALVAAVVVTAASDRTVVLLGVAALVGAASLPLPNAIDDEARRDEIASRIRTIDSTSAPLRWTVVAEPAALTLVPEGGFFIDAGTFLDSYDAAAWRFDPERPSLSVPTRHVYLFVSTAAADDTVANETGGATDILGFDDLTSGGAAGDESSALAAWVAEYDEGHDDLRVAYRDDDLTVFHIERSREEEERATRLAERRREERRRTATRCRATGDHLVFPTPRAFEECS